MKKHNPLYHGPVWVSTGVILILAGAAVGVIYLVIQARKASTTTTTTTPAVVGGGIAQNEDGTVS